jgi:hypothetical protein
MTSELRPPESLLAGGGGELPRPLPRRAGQWRVLDAGCGSGLIGRLFTWLVGLPALSTEALLTPQEQRTTEEERTEEHRTEEQRTEEHRTEGDGLAGCRAGPCMVGVDVSEQMARLARVNGGYSCTVCADLEGVLEQFAGGGGGGGGGGSAHDVKKDDKKDDKRSDSNDDSDDDDVRDKHSSRSSEGGAEGQQGGALQPLDLLVAADTFLYVGALEEVSERGVGE